MKSAERDMDFEERLKLWKKEKALRPRPDAVVRTWREIEKASELSTKEKLEKLIRLTRPAETRPSRRGTEEPASRRPFQIFENHFHLNTRYGKIRLTAGLKIKGEILSRLGRDESFLALDLNSALFLDLETTGLSGGVGVVPFLVGLGFYREEKFHIVQFFLGDPAEEAALVSDLAAFFQQMKFRSVVTFNGKGFDLPLLETRFILNRKTLPISGLPHLDFLFPARSLWSHKQENCRLFQLARDILQAEREEDISSAEIPWRYFEYLRTGDFSLIEPVLYHNQEDILSLLGVVIVGAGLLVAGDEESLGVEGDAMDFFGAAKILERTGDLEKSAFFLQRALAGRLSESVAIETKKRLARYFKKNEDWEKAVGLWQEMTPSRQLVGFRELAMYYEHRQKDYEKARQIAEEGLELAAGISRAYEKDFSHRLERLRAKVRRQEKKGCL